VAKVSDASDAAILADKKKKRREKKISSADVRRPMNVGNLWNSSETRAHFRFSRT